jgi:hypothetical protein
MDKRAAQKGSLPIVPTGHGVDGGLLRNLLATEPAGYALPVGAEVSGEFSLATKDAPSAFCDGIEEMFDGAAGVMR